jgi:hypothetical protein
MNFGSDHGAGRFTAKAADFSRSLLAVIAEDVRTWDVFRWAVVMLLALNVLFLLSFTGSIRSEIAALSEEQSAGIDQLARVTKEIADTRASLTQAISDTRSGLQGDIAKLNEIEARLQRAPDPGLQGDIAKTNTKVDAGLQQAPTASPTPAAALKTSAKPRPPSSRSRWPW